MNSKHVRNLSFRSLLLVLLLVAAMVGTTACSQAAPRRVILPGASEQRAEDPDDETEVPEVIENATEEASAAVTETEQTPATETEEVQGADMRYATAEVRVRRTASTKGIIAGKLQLNEAVEVIAEEGDWCKIMYNDTECFVAAEYLTKVDPNGEAAGENASEAGEEQQEATPAQTASTPENPNGKVICIDAGHQIKQNKELEPIGPGAKETKKKVSSGTAGKWSKWNEYELNLVIALKLQTELEKRGYSVIQIRTDHEVDISNVERANIANENNVDAFLRIHADGSDNDKVNGTFTICQTSKSPYNADIYEQCFSLATKVVDAICEQTGSKNRGVMQSDNYTGINWCKVPVTIIEMGYMSNKEEDLLMATEEYQDKIVTGIANGIDAYFAQ